MLTPTLDGDIVVWTDYRRAYASGEYSYYDVYMYNFATGVEAPVCNENGWQDQADVDGTRVVWTDGQRDIYLRDVASPTSVKQQITTDPADQQRAAIHGNLIVWEDFRNEVSNDDNSDIYAYNLATSTEIPICTNTAPQTHPAVYGNTIVWRDERHGGGDIYMYDLTTSTETRITTVTSIAPCELTVPAIDDTLIVWTDYRHGNPDIYLYDLDTATEAPVCTDPATQASAAVYGNRVVWTDERHGQADIYMGEITILNKPASAKHLLEELQDEIDALASTDLKPPSTDRQDDLRAKLDAIIAKINAGQYHEALKKLTKDILPKLDSTAKQTWLLTTQPDLLALIHDIIDYLEALI
jgi:beta propeller repeat protein